MDGNFFCKRRYHLNAWCHIPVPYGNMLHMSPTNFSYSSCQTRAIHKSLSVFKRKKEKSQEKGRAISREKTRQKVRSTRQKIKTEDSKVESNDSPESLDWVGNI